MEQCSNTQALNRHLQEQVNVETIQEEFQNNVEEQLRGIADQLSLIRASAKDYEGYDLTEFANELIGDTI
jgi:endonuclease III-like uncharacterized protein